MCEDFFTRNSYKFGRQFEIVHQLKLVVQSEWLNLDHHYLKSLIESPVNCYCQKLWILLFYKSNIKYTKEQKKLRILKYV